MIVVGAQFNARQGGPPGFRRMTAQRQISVRSASEQRVLHIDAKVAHRVLDLGVTKQDLDGADVSRRLVDHRRLRAPKRVSAILLRTEADRADPFVNQTRVLPCAHVACVINPARECIILDRASAPFERGQKAGSHIAGDLELDGTTGLLLDDDRASPDLCSGDHIANPDLDQVAAAKLAVDCQIEQCPVPNTSLAIEEKANCPYLLLGERTLRADLLAGIPGARSRLASSNIEWPM